LRDQARRRLYWGLVGTSIVLTAVGQLSMKAGMHALADMSGPPTLPALMSAPVLLWTGAGLLCYGTSLLVWLAVLARYPLSLGYPLLSISYILVYIGATHWPGLMETATLERTAGTILIAIGVAFVSLSGRR
jgi:undecaprenyl phosphate-alpha-L-ara4N flippase subunit ArnF